LIEVLELKSDVTQLLVSGRKGRTIYQSRINLRSQAGLLQEFETGSNTAKNIESIEPM
jgi:hypothetical protein